MKAPVAAITRGQKCDYFSSLPVSGTKFINSPFKMLPLPASSGEWSVHRLFGNVRMSSVNYPTALEYGLLRERLLYELYGLLKSGRPNSGVILIPVFRRVLR